MHVLGIDAGGTKTVGLLADLDGQVVSTARGPGANLQTDGELGVEKTLHDVLERAVGLSSLEPAVICLGMAGVDRESDARVVRGIMRRIGARARVLVVNDALVALVAALGLEPGIVLLSGTGSIAYGHDGQGRAARAGGFGPLLGDEGSGYWIGCRALQAVARASDGRGPATALTALVLAHFGVEGVPQLVHEVYERTLPRPVVARLAGAVHSAREAGDELATRILEEAAHELVAAARSVGEQLAWGERPGAFVLAGGVFAGVPWLEDELRRRLPALAPGCRVERLRHEPALGAVRLALEEAHGGARLPRYAA